MSDHIYDPRSIGHPSADRDRHKASKPAMCGKGLRVRVIGAGTGGLCLAQGLKQDNVEVEFERDHTPTVVQGYRLSISSTGRRALKECLTHPLRAYALKDERILRTRCGGTV
jgi:2-polyprenyl-6-methoxyphenol hydroxylase-like FAD-dependent oxidoreductase